MNTFQKFGTTSEKELIRKASISRAERFAFKRHVTPLAREIADMYIAKYNLSPNYARLLTIVGLNSFDRAFTHYIRKMNIFEQEPFKFTSYLSWWIRQYIRMYLRQHKIIA